MAITGTILAATAVVATGASIYEGEQANSQQKKAQNYQRQQNDLQAARQQRDAVRQARIAAATAVQAGANQGVSNSSAVQGGVGSIQSQTNDNVSFLDTYNKLSDQASTALGKASEFQTNASIFGSVANLATSAYSYSGKK